MQSASFVSHVELMAGAVLALVDGTQSEGSGRKTEQVLFTSRSSKSLQVRVMEALVEELVLYVLVAE